MSAPLEYFQPRTEQRSWRPVVAVLLFIAGGGAVLLGGLLGFIAANSFYASRTNPNWTWGPNNYLLGMMKNFLYTSLVLLPSGIAFIWVGWYLRRARRPGT